MNESVRCENANEFIENMNGLFNEFEKLIQTIFSLPKVVKYFHEIGQQFMAENDASLFINNVAAYWNQEKERYYQYLDPDSDAHLMNILLNSLIGDHIQEVIDWQDSGLKSMLDNNQREDLNALFELLKCIPNGVNIMTASLLNYGNVEKPDSEDPFQFITDLLDTKNKCDKLVHKFFNNNDTLKMNILLHISTLLKDNRRSAEFLSIFIDKKVKAQHEDFSTFLDQAMIIFKLLSEKDVFEKYYKKHLAKRLLLAKNVNFDDEKEIILRLKGECGNSFTKNMEKMVADIETSLTLIDSFKNANYKNEIYMAVKVLSSDYWPISKPPICKLPTVAEEAFNKFKEFYCDQKHSNRTLTLLPNIGTAEIEATFYEKLSDGLIKGATNIFVVSTYQMCILLCFNDCDSLRLMQLSETTQIPDRDLKLALESLTLKDQNILMRCKGDTEKIETFKVNEKFTSISKKIHVKPVSRKGADREKEQKEMQEKVKIDRKHEIKAAVVRVMKSRQNLIHNELMAEVIAQLQPRFQPDPAVIKKRIESLIEREYLKRDENNLQIYYYVA